MIQKILRKDSLCLLVLLLLSLALFAYKMGAFGLLDPDEPFYAQTAHEMILRHDASTPVLFGHPQFEKPIFFYWVLYACFRFFGVSPFAARLGPCVAGILLVLLTYLWGRVLFRRRATAFISAAVLATAFETIVLSRIVLTDIFLCLFTAAALFSFSIGYRAPGRRKAAWRVMFFFAGLGFLTKGPLGLLLPLFGVVPFLWLNGEAELLKEIPWLSGLGLFALVGLPWYVWMAVKEGPAFVGYFFLHENVRRFFVAEHKSFDKFLFYPLDLWIGFFPWSAALPGALWYAAGAAVKKRTPAQKTFLFLALSWFVPFVFFSFAKSKLLSYVFPVFPVVALIIGAWSYRFYRAVRLGFRETPGLRALGVLFFALAPPLIAVAAFELDRFKHFGAGRLIGLIAVWFVALSWAGGLMLWRRKPASAFALITANMVVFSVLVFGRLLPRLDAQLSCKPAGLFYERYLKEGGARRLVLADKMYVRGTAYYTGEEIATVSDDAGPLFYTPHPIPVVRSARDLDAFDRAEFPLYCFLRPKSLSSLERVMGPGYSVSVIQDNGVRLIAKLEPANSLR